MNYFFCFLKDFSRPELTVINNFATINNGLALLGAVLEKLNFLFLKN